MGNKVKSKGHERVIDNLMLTRTSPSRKIKRRIFSWVTS